MVFHSHYTVTDKKGVVHNFCCYKECSEQVEDYSDSETETSITHLDNAVNTALTDLTDLIKSNSSNEPVRPLSRRKKDEKIPDKPSSMNNNSDKDDESFTRPKKPPRKKGPIFKLKLSSDMVSESYRKRQRAYRAAMMNKVPSGYSSDEYIEMDTDIESQNNNDSDVGISSKSSTKRGDKIDKIPYIIVDDSEDAEDAEDDEGCIEIDETEFSKTANSRSNTDTELSNNFKAHNNCLTDSSSNPADDSNSEIVNTNLHQKVDLSSFRKAVEHQKEVESFRKAVEDARNAMISLVDKFYFEQSIYVTDTVTSSSESQSSQGNSSKTQEGFVNVPFTISKSDLVNTDKISLENKKKNTQVSLQASGTSEFPIDLDHDDNFRSPISPISPILPIELNDSEDNSMINWFNRDDFKKFMLNSAKRRLEELDDQRPRKHIKSSGQSSSRHNVNKNKFYRIESPKVQIPVFKNQKYLKIALTHSSVYSDQRNIDERLEFFGDCILSTTISQMAYEKFRNQLTPDLLEQIHEELCSNYRLCQFAKMLKLQDLVYAGKPFLNEKEMANIFMSLLAAIIMDCGREVAVDFIRKVIGPTMNILVNNGNFVGTQINDMNETIPIKNVIDGL